MFFKVFSMHFQASECLRNALDLCSYTDKKIVENGCTILHMGGYTITIVNVTPDTLELKITDNNKRPLFEVQFHQYHPYYIKKILVFKPGKWRESLQKTADFIRHRAERDARRDYENHYC